ncbi:MAG: hypothetical protein JW839_21240 [Candidatus Lokiarchaeota archaeon]|nr:hypothetical protein [Candidatus Lokiarchaeota archaeon]
MQGANIYDVDGLDDECEDRVDEDTCAEEFKINGILSVRLEDDGPRMYVNGRPFDQCAYPVLNDSSYQDDENDYGASNWNPHIPRKAARSVDAFLWKGHGTLDHPGYVEDPCVSMKELYWGLCSTLQAWAENDYDTRLLHANLAFPLARALANAGDAVAKARFEREVISRWKSDFEPVQHFLFHGGFLNGLSPGSLVDIIAHGGPRHVIDTLSRQIDARVLVETWKGQKSKVQLRIIEQFKHVIEQLDPPSQIVLLAGCASFEVGEALVRVVDVARLPSSQLQPLREKRRTSRIIALAGL